MPQQLKDLPIRPKLYGGFAVVLLLLLAVAAAGLWSGQSVFSSTKRIGNGTGPRIRAAEKIQFDESSVYGYQTSYVLGEVASQRKGFDTYVGIVQGDIQTLRHFATDARYRAALATIVTGVNGFLATDRTIWHDVNLGTPAAKAQAANLTLSAEATPYGQMLSGAMAYLTHAQAGQDEALATAGSDHSTGMVLTIVLALVALILGGGIAFFVARAIKGSVDVILARLRSLRDHCAADLKAGIEALAGGDLTVDVQSVTPPIDLRRADEMGQMGEAVGALREGIIATVAAYNQTRENLSRLVGEVSGSAGQVSAASQQVASTSQESGKVSGEIANAIGGIAQGAERQVHAVEQAQRTAEQVGEAVSAAAQTAQQTAHAAHEARDIAQRGVGAAEQADAAMRSVSDSSQEVNAAIRELAAKSEQIGAIVETITGIAEQTNLLALNAAIEAARAGEQGRGFAVVAEEVRKLAEGSQDAGHEIAGLVAAIQQETSRAVEVVNDGAQRTQDGVVVVEETRHALVEIGQAVEDMAVRIEQIAEVSQQIALSTESMQANIADVASVAEESSASTEQVSASTQESSASAEQIAASAYELSGNAERLNELVARFKVGGQGRASGGS